MSDPKSNQPRTTEGEASPVTDADANGAMRLALQRAEPRRLALLLLVVGLAFALSAVRRATGGKAMQGMGFALVLTLLAVMVGYAVAFRTIVGRANQRGRLLPAWMSAMSTIVEALFPTAAIFMLVEGGQVRPLEAVTAPSLVFYGVINVLTILRMRPWLSLLCGFVCAAGHAGVLAYVIAGLDTTLGSGGGPYYASYPVVLAITGVAAAFVSFEVRKYFRASLREAEARRRLDLVQRDVEIARSIQQGLMPEKQPDLPGFDIAGSNRPADRTGGDYYDWQLLPDGRLAVVIADVTGHGLGPALLMAVCRAYARACMPVGPELRTSMRRVNALLHADVTSGRFVTFAAAVLDPGTREVEILSAGHGPLLYLHRASGNVDEINGDGVPLGIVDDEDYGAPRRMRMEPGDILLLVTDGIFEWARGEDGEQYGVARMRKFLLDNAALDSRTLIDRLDADVRAFAVGTTQPDDMTIVAIRRT